MWVFFFCLNGFNNVRVTLNKITFKREILGLAFSMSMCDAWRYEKIECDYVFIIFCIGYMAVTHGITVVVGLILKHNTHVLCIKWNMDLCKLPYKDCYVKSLISGTGSTFGASH